MAGGDNDAAREEVRDDEVGVGDLGGEGHHPDVREVLAACAAEGVGLLVGLNNVGRRMATRLAWG